MSMYGKNHYNTVISLQLIKINEKKMKEEKFRKKNNKAYEWLYGSQETVENSSRDRNTRTPYLLPEKPVRQVKKQS